MTARIHTSESGEAATALSSEENRSDSRSNPKFFTSAEESTTPSKDFQTTLEIITKGNSNIDYYQTIIKPKLNFVYEIKDHNVREEFVEYNFQNISCSFLFYLNLLLSFILLPMAIIGFVMSFPPTSASLNSNNHPSNENHFLSILKLVFSSLELFSCLSAVLTGWILYYCRHYYHNHRPRSNSYSSLRRLFQPLLDRFYDDKLRIQFLFLVSIHLLSLMKFMTVQVVNECSQLTKSFYINKIVSSWSCQRTEEFPIGIPDNSSMILILAPFFCCIALREPLWWSCLLAHTIVVSAFLGVTINELDASLVAMTFAWWTGGTILFYDLHKQHLINFFITDQLKAALKENVKYAEQIQANEMKHMIANVAHDLKTPLASFTSGVELISQILKDSRKLLDTFDSSTYDTSLLASYLASIQPCLQNLRSTNAFMIMAINRCIDYTKASNGLKLVPKYETIMLKESLQLPLNCMKNIQDQCTIELLPIPSEICNTVITDKQWLQENVLCLLSNAVKYSTAGAITVSISLIREDDVCFSVEQSLPALISENSPLEVSKKRDKSPHCENFIFATSSDRTVTSPPISSDLANQRNTHTTMSSDRTQASSSFPVSFHNLLLASPTNKANLVQYLKFTIEDNGIGMTEQAMKTLFHPFKQTQRLAGGTGLGLYSLAKRVEALHGKYGVEPRKDGKKGSLFWFALPYRPDQNEFTMLGGTMSSGLLSDSNLDSSSTVSQPSQVTSMTQSSKEKTLVYSFKDNSDVPCSLNILIVDDSSAIIKMLTMLLKKQGHSTQIASNGEIALKAIEDRWKQCQKPFEIILMDLQMPVMDGLEATRRLRRMESEGRDWMRSEECYSHHHVIIGMSANSDHDTTAEAYESGVDAFMGKPFSIELFNKTVLRLLKNAP